MTDILRIDVLSLFDLDFKGEGIARSTLKVLKDTPQREDFSSRFAESFAWIFYGSSLPGCQRFSFGPPSGIKNNVEGVSVLINPEYGAGVYSVWHKFNGNEHPLSRRKEAGEKSEEDLMFLETFGLSQKGERNYPFIGIRVNTSDVGKYCAEHAVELGRVFTGNPEKENKAQLEAYIRENLSRREYEQLFLRWTEGLGVYASNIDEDMDEKYNEKMYEKSLFRAVQIFEICILVRRLLRNITETADDLSGRLSMVIPRPFAVNRLSQTFLEVQRVLVSGPPVQSVEAERLLRTAYRSFGINALVDSTRQSCDFLERRFQWVKTQFLVAIGIITYLLDKLNLFADLRRICEALLTRWR